ncbi:MAG TPA: efflux RND transporter periplasmic adaptor subunit [Holophagaceae bacterium]|nr:efflux RND transporter periplasmic adaptor subunit [Holophagaceae bacterium]
MAAPRRLTRYLLPAAALLGAGLLAWAFVPAPLPVDTGQVTRGPFAEVITEEARTRARDRYVVAAPVAGRLLRVGLKPGDPVKAGQTLAVLLPPDTPLRDLRAMRDLEERAGAAEAALARARAQEAQARAAREQAELDLARLRRLEASGAAARADLDRAASAARMQGEAAAAAGEEVHAQTHALATARAELALAGHGRERAAVRAPVDGVLLRVLQESETVVAAGTPLLELYPPGDLEVVADLLSSDAVAVTAGAPVRFTQWGGAAPLDGVVRRVEPVAFTKVSPLGVEEQRVHVLADFTSPAAAWSALGDGYRLEARIEVFAAPDLLQVPTAALFRRGEGWAVFAVEGGRARLRAVDLGRRGERTAELRGGLRAGETVILYPGDQVQEGVRVAARPEPAPSAP